MAKKARVMPKATPKPKPAVADAKMPSTGVIKPMKAKKKGT